MATEDALLTNLERILQRVEESLDRLEGNKVKRVTSQSQITPVVSSSALDRRPSSTQLSSNATNNSQGPASMAGSRQTRRVPKLEDVISDNELYMAFFSYLKAKHIEESLEFYSSVNAYHWRVDNNLPPNQIAELGRGTYEKYVKNGAEKQIALDESYLEAISSQVAAGNWGRNLFDGALSMLRLDLNANFQSWLKISNYRI